MMSRSAFFFFALSLSLTLAAQPAAAYSRYDPMYRFALAYTQALTRCDPAQIARFYSRYYTAFELDGETYGKPRLVKSVNGWCQTYGSSTFELVEYKRASRTQFYTVMKMHFDGFETGEIRYSQSFTVKRSRRYGYLITADLRGINGERIAEALA